MTIEKQIVAGPLTVWVKEFMGPGAPAVPDLSADRAAINAAGWSLLGLRGADSQKRDGGVISLTQESAEFMPAGGTKATDRWRTKEELSLKFSLVDLRAETLAAVLDQTARAITGGLQVGLGRPLDMKLWSVLARGRSPYLKDRAKVRQYLLYAATVTSNYEEVAKLEEPGAVDFEFKALALESVTTEAERFGILQAANV